MSNEEILRIELAKAKSKPLTCRLENKSFQIKKRKSLILRGTGNAKNNLPKDMADSFVYAVSAYATELLESYKEVTNEISAKNGTVSRARARA